MSAVSAFHRNTILHTDSLLRKHGLMILQDFARDSFSYVDYRTYELASEQRIAAYEKEAEVV